MARKKNHSQKESIWLVFLKKEKIAFKHNEALEEALCLAGSIPSLNVLMINKQNEIFSPQKKQ